MTLKLNLNAKAWSVLALILLAYGLAVFGVTRAIYTSDRAALPVPPLPWGSSYHETAGGTLSTTGMKRMVSALDGRQPLPAAVSPQDLARLADESFRDGDYSQAAAYYAKVLEGSPHNVDVYNNLGITLHYLGRSSDALETLQKGIAIDDSHQRIWLTLGFVQAQTGNAPDARQALQRAIDLDPQSPIGSEAATMLERL